MRLDFFSSKGYNEFCIQLFWNEIIQPQIFGEAINKQAHVCILFCLLIYSKLKNIYQRKKKKLKIKRYILLIKYQTKNEILAIFFT
jgi:hypothetical protein